MPRRLCHVLVATMECMQRFVRRRSSFAKAQRHGRARILWRSLSSFAADGSMHKYRPAKLPRGLCHKHFHRLEPLHTIVRRGHSDAPSHRANCGLHGRPGVRRSAADDVVQHTKLPRGLCHGTLGIMDTLHA